MDSERDRGWPADKWRPIATAPDDTLVRIREVHNAARREKIASRRSSSGVWTSNEGGILLPLSPDEWQPIPDDAAQ